jgi:hypothetical protein
LTFPDGTTSTGAVITAAQSSSYIIQTLGPANASPSNVLSTFEFGVDGTLTLPGNIRASSDLSITVPSGIPNGVANWIGQGGWNQGSYINTATTGGSGTGLTVDVAAAGQGYIGISQITINNPGTGYTNGDVITINNENDLPGTFTITVPEPAWEFGANGGLTFPDSSVQSSAYPGVLVPANGDNTVGNANLVFYDGSWNNTSRLTINPSTSMLTINGNNGVGGITLPRGGIVKSYLQDALTMTVIPGTGGNSSGNLGHGVDQSPAGQWSDNVTYPPGTLCRLTLVGATEDWIQYNNVTLYTRNNNGENIVLCPDSTLVNTIDVVTGTFVSGTLTLLSDSVAIQSNNSTWQFGSDGTTTLAGGNVFFSTATNSTVMYNNGISVSTATAYSIDTYGTAGSNGLYWFEKPGSIATGLWNAVRLNSPEDASTGSLVISTGQFANRKNWIFGSTGTITFPDGTTQTTAFTVGGTVANTGTTSTFVISNTSTSNSTNTGALQVAGGVGVAGGVFVGGNITATNITALASTATVNSTAASVGYMGLPQNATSSTTLTISDAGKHIYVTTSSQTITIPANSSVPYPIGTAITFIAGPSATTATIAITSDTMRLAGAGTTGSRTLAAHGMATAVKVSGTSSAGVWYINGTGLT